MVSAKCELILKSGVPTWNSLLNIYGGLSPEKNNGLALATDCESVYRGIIYIR